MTGKYIVCVICGKDKYVPKCHLDRNPIYCAKECQNIGKLTNKNIPKRKEAKCTICAKKFVSFYRTDRDTYSKCCSRQCASKYTGGKKAGINNPNYKPKVVTKCCVCGNKMSLQPSRIRINNVCSSSCRVIHIHSRRVKRTNIEVVMFNFLTEIGANFTEQVPMYNRWVVDFVLNDCNTIIFCDGIYWHSKPSVVYKDKGQTNYLKQCGWKVLRYTDKEILSNFEIVKQDIFNHINP